MNTRHVLYWRGGEEDRKPYFVGIHLSHVLVFSDSKTLLDKILYKDPEREISRIFLYV